MPVLSLLFVLMSVTNYGMITGENASFFTNYHTQKYYDMRLFSLSADEIKSAEASWGARYRRKLEINEIYSLITMLQRVNKEDINPYNGPSPKGGPFQVTLLLKSNEQFDLTWNGEYILFRENQIFQPEFREFKKQILKSTLK
ncbi:hypothetical protein [Paenibacillus spongiae]|uniref:Uncharacterized protein n=1 Tax=Paenibacillus spongiae TaxID=2909671 RepID=A0ABY5S2N5_9BACL|nr:hypothetical protein [Paenibacillus spongiae]UVI28149.1 hypothetical protein L1F29_22185 [Paenibacillus spongiae]